MPNPPTELAVPAELGVEHFAAQAVMSGTQDVVLAGGV